MKTLTNALLESFEASLRVPEGTCPPVALLWTDADSQWSAVLPALRKVQPALYSLGLFAPEERQGPAIWLKCIVDRTLAEMSPPLDVTPIIYLPNVSRQELRAGGDCAPDLQPLVELLYRGCAWHQRNGRDWSVEAFLTSEAGLALDVSQDARTRTAMARALSQLASEPVDNLRGRRLEADDFDRLTIGDPVRDLLNWMNDPERFEALCNAFRWATFKDVCFREFAVRVDEDGVDNAADHLLNDNGRWDEVWRRFCDAPKLYPNVADLLRRARPRNLLVDVARRPDVNDEQEEALRQGLEGSVSLPHVEACERVLALEKEHAQRRDWVWARMGESPFANALQPLARLAAAARSPLGGASLEQAVIEYADYGWQCDRFAIEALARLREGKASELIGRVTRTLYEPWLDRSARHFQSLMSQLTVEPSKLVQSVESEPETCVLFVDGLRYDIGAVLQEKLEARGFRARLRKRMTAIPTVTATAKPLASSAHAGMVGDAKTIDFSPLISPNGSPLTAARLREALTKQGTQILDDDLQTRMPLGNTAGGYAEVGELDHFGHHFGARLAYQIEPEVDSVVDRVIGIFDAGWPKVRIVTDHGWLLLPGGLPRVDLPPYLVETKWARCAVVQGGSMTNVPTYPWYWNPLVRIATPPGCAAFRANTEYAHGGISPQECITPDLLIEQNIESVTAKIISAAWRGMRVRVLLDGSYTGLRADLRLNWKQASSSIIATPKYVSENGEVSLAVSDDKHEGSAAAITLIDASGRVLDHFATTVGEAS